MSAEPLVARDISRVRYAGWHEVWQHYGDGSSERFMRMTMVADCEGKQIWAYHQESPEDYLRQLGTEETRAILQNMLLTLQYAEIGPDGKFR